MHEHDQDMHQAIQAVIIATADVLRAANVENATSLDAGPSDRLTAAVDCLDVTLTHLRRYEGSPIARGAVVTCAGSATLALIATAGI